MIYVDECILTTIKFLKAPRENLKRSVYNLGGISFTPEELAASVKKLIPGLEVTYEPCPTKSVIAESWPQSLDDQFAQEEWGHRYNVTVDELAYQILDNIAPEYKEGKLLNMDKTITQHLHGATKRF